jgi:flagellar protein FlbD
MIRLHKLGRTPAPFHLNPDLVLTVEASPDTVVTFTTGSRLLVTESPEEVAAAVRTWRASVLDAMTRVPRRSSASLALVRGTAGDGGVAAIKADEAGEESELPSSPKERRP